MIHCLIFYHLSLIFITYNSVCLSCSTFYNLVKLIYPHADTHFSNNLSILIKLYLHKLWNYMHLSENPNITWEIVKINKDKPWNWRLLSENPNITYEIVKENPKYPWDWAYLSANPNLPWNYMYLSKNPNITWKIVKTNKDKLWSWLSEIQI